MHFLDELLYSLPEGRGWRRRVTRDTGVLEELAWEDRAHPIGYILQEERGWVRIAPYDRLLEPLHTHLLREGLEARLSMLRRAHDDTLLPAVETRIRDPVRLSSLLEGALRTPVITRMSRLIHLLAEREGWEYTVERWGAHQSYSFIEEDGEGVFTIEIGERLLPPRGMTRYRFAWYDESRGVRNGEVTLTSRTHEITRLLKEHARGRAFSRTRGEA